MSSSSFRPFRHTATFIALTLLTAICQATGKISTELKNTELQAKKQSKSSAGNRLSEQLKQKAAELTEVKESLEVHMNDFFDR